MNAYAKLALGLAVAVVGAVVAYNLLPGNGMGLAGPPMATASPSVLPSPTPSSPATTPGADVWPVGPLGVAPHDVKLLGVPFSFTMPSPDSAERPWRHREHSVQPRVGHPRYRCLSPDEFCLVLLRWSEHVGQH